jgi:hypothetical protein
MKLIPDWRQAWRMLSMRVAFLAVIWGSLPAELQAEILGGLGVSPGRVPLFIGLTVMVVRIIAQKKLADAAAATQRAGGPGGPTGPV